MRSGKIEEALLLDTTAETNRILQRDFSRLFLESAVEGYRVRSRKTRLHRIVVVEAQGIGVSPRRLQNPVARRGEANRPGGAHRLRNARVGPHDAPRTQVF